MSYEYNSESKLLDLPNPFKIENFFYFLAAFVMIISAMELLLVSRSALLVHLTFLSIFPFLIGVVLLIIGINSARHALGQLRFFFGRGEPKSLAYEIGVSETEKGSGADELKEHLRHNALLFKEPQGGLNGMLYSWIPNLIYAPRLIQNFAQRQFYNVWVIAAILLSLSVSWLSFGSSKSSAWMGLFFYFLTLFVIIKPFTTGGSGQSNLGIKGLILLVIVAVLGPVILPIISRNWIDISIVNFNLQSFVVLILSLVANVIFFIALIKQLPPPPTTTTSCEQLSMSMNSHPKQLLDELDRELQKNWTEQIPNRRYIKIPPIINQDSGEFIGELLEESQPMPSNNSGQIDYQVAMTSPRHQWLIWLNIYGVLLTCAGVTLWIMFAVLLNPASINLVSDMHVIRYLSLGFAILVLSNYCFSSGHMLWGRLDFTSQLTWVEMYGNYQSGKLDYGNVLNDNIKSEKNIINIENMTLRVWVSELETASFDKTSPRFIVGMRGLPEQSAYIASLLKDFAENQSIVIAPKSFEDIQKLTQLAAMNNLTASKQDGSSTLAAMNNHLKSCHACKAQIASNDKFCGVCGAPCQ